MRLLCKYCRKGMIEQASLPCNCPSCGKRLTKVEHEPRTEWHRLLAWLTELYGEELGLFLAKRMGKAIKKTGPDPCLDNFRVCDMNIPSEVVLYEEAQSNGCCGSHDETIEHFKTGRLFKFGFNYGH